MLKGEFPVLMAHHKTAASKSRRTSKVVEKRSISRTDSGGPRQVKGNALNGVEGRRGVTASRTLTSTNDEDAHDIECDPRIQRKQRRSPNEAIDDVGSRSRPVNGTGERSASDLSHREVSSSRCLAELKSLREEVSFPPHSCNVTTADADGLDSWGGT